MNYLRAFLLLCVATAANAVQFNDFPVGDPARGGTINQTCVACHGQDGKGLLPSYPNLGGQYEEYLVEELVAFRMGPEGSRNNPIMVGMAAGLSDQDIADLAAYYAAQPHVVGDADPALVERGQKLYWGGNVAEKIPACSGCHGPAGMGNEAANFPVLSGQNAEYIISQLVAFRAGTRGGGTNGMMHGVVKYMTPQDMEAVASYIQGLH